MEETPEQCKAMPFKQQQATKRQFEAEDQEHRKERLSKKRSLAQVALMKEDS